MVILVTDRAWLHGVPSRKSTWRWTLSSCRLLLHILKMSHTIQGRSTIQYLVLLLAMLQCSTIRLVKHVRLILMRVWYSDILLAIAHTVLRTYQPLMSWSFLLARQQPTLWFCPTHIQNSLVWWVPWRLRHLLQQTELCRIPLVSYTSSTFSICS